MIPFTLSSITIYVLLVPSSDSSCLTTCNKYGVNKAVNEFYSNDFPKDYVRRKYIHFVTMATVEINITHDNNSSIIKVPYI